MQIRDGSRDYKAIKEQPMQMNARYILRRHLFLSFRHPPHSRFFLLLFSPSSCPFATLSRSDLCFLRSYYLATTKEESAVQHLYRISTRTNAADRKPRCLSCGIIRETDRNRCLYNTAKFSTDHSNYVLTCAGPGVPDIGIYNRVSVARQTIHLFYSQLPRRC